jgi:hypothetical protein
MDDVKIIKGLLVYSVDVGNMPREQMATYLQTQSDSLSALTSKLHAQGIVLMMIPVRDGNKIEYTPF